MCGEYFSVGTSGPTASVSSLSDVSTQISLYMSDKATKWCDCKGLVYTSFYAFQLPVLLFKILILLWQTVGIQIDAFIEWPNALVVPVTDVSWVSPKSSFLFIRIALDARTRNLPVCPKVTSLCETFYLSLEPSFMLTMQLNKWVSVFVGKIQW